MATGSVGSSEQANPPVTPNACATDRTPAQTRCRWLHRRVLLEHDDANCALMVLTLPRQAVPVFEIPEQLSGGYWHRAYIVDCTVGGTSRGGAGLRGCDLHRGARASMPRPVMAK